MSNLKNFQDTKVEDIPKEGIVAIKLSAPWCNPCNVLAPQFEALENATLGTVNMDEDNDFMVTFGVRTIPTTLIFRKGLFFGKVAGAKIEDIKTMIEAAHVEV